ncbi:YbjO family protein [Edwardsiella ictaluri]|uniref:YbjO family protein n=1 Tax=Edwardsiella ictaluri TaxID=67780 RepID=UPI0022281D76|nr:YbjO family protein [Edwardsiella ictaluri]UCQ49977.1 YbjO family protein [Edwardsiella ictaluri]
MLQRVRVPPRSDGGGFAPVPVLVAGMAIIGIRLAGALLLLVTQGVAGLTDFIGGAWQTWEGGALLLACLGLWLAELGCGAAVMRGSAYGCGIYLGCQLLVTGYMLCSSLGGFHPELFSVDGDDSGQIVRALLGQKLPDLLILALLFIPSASRRYFRQRL